MRRFFLSLLVIIGTSINASAATISWKSSDLPYDSKTASCEEILTHANKNNATRMVAGGVYIHGKRMGKRCMKPDYVKGFELWNKVGATSQMRSVLRSLEIKASTDNPFAKSQLRKLEKAGWIKRLRP